jgi:hypothetical protein
MKGLFLLTPLFDRLSDAALNKVGLRYNQVCLYLLVIAIPLSLIVTLTGGFGGMIRRDSTLALIFQVWWLPIWLPNLLLIGVRSDRDYRRWAKVNEELKRVEGLTREAADRLAVMGVVEMTIEEVINPPPAVDKPAVH